MDNWHQHTQGNKSANEYVEKFDEFIIRRSTQDVKMELKFFLHLELILGMTYELNCKLNESTS